MTSSASDDGGYVHDPSAFDETGDRRDSDAAGSESDGTGDSAPDRGDDPTHPAAVDREFDWRGWVLVGVIVFAFFVAPATIILLPPTEYLFALIALPLVPAALLAITAVWATTRP